MEKKSQQAVNQWLIDLADALKSNGIIKSYEDFAESIGINSASQLSAIRGALKTTEPNRNKNASGSMVFNALLAYGNHPKASEIDELRLFSALFQKQKQKSLRERLEEMLDSDNSNLQKSIAAIEASSKAKDDQIKAEQDRSKILLEENIRLRAIIQNEIKNIEGELGLKDGS